MYFFCMKSSFVDCIYTYYHKITSAEPRKIGDRKHQDLKIMKKISEKYVKYKKDELHFFFFAIKTNKKIRKI